MSDDRNDGTAVARTKMELSAAKTNEVSTIELDGDLKKHGIWDQG